MKTLLKEPSLSSLEKTSEKTRKKLREERRNFGEKRKLASKNESSFKKRLWRKTKVGK